MHKGAVFRSTVYNLCSGEVAEFEDFQSGIDLRPSHPWRFRPLSHAAEGVMRKFAALLWLAPRAKAR
jgi:hypothetical protein